MEITGAAAALQVADLNKQAQAYVIVRVQDRYCALPVAQVVEVLRVPHLGGARVDVPGMLGVMTLRGVPVAVFSFAHLVGIAATHTALVDDEDEKQRRLISLRGDRSADAPSVLALMVDEVIGVQTMEPGSLTELFLPGGREQHIGRFEGRLAELLQASGLVPLEALEFALADAEQDTTRYGS